MFSTGLHFCHSLDLVALKANILPKTDSNRIARDDHVAPVGCAFWRSVRACCVDLCRHYLLLYEFLEFAGEHAFIAAL